MITFRTTFNKSVKIIKYIEAINYLLIEYGIGSYNADFMIVKARINSGVYFIVDNLRRWEL